MYTVSTLSNSKATAALTIVILAVKVKSWYPSFDNLAVTSWTPAAVTALPVYSTVVPSGWPATLIDFAVPS